MKQIDVTLEDTIFCCDMISRKGDELARKGTSLMVMGKTDEGRRYLDRAHYVFSLANKLMNDYNNSKLASLLVVEPTEDEIAYARKLKKEGWE